MTYFIVKTTFQLSGNDAPNHFLKGKLYFESDLDSCEWNGITRADKLDFLRKNRFINVNPYINIVDLVKDLLFRNQ